MDVKGCEIPFCLVSSATLSDIKPACSISHSHMPPEVTVSHYICAQFAIIDLMTSDVSHKQYNLGYTGQAHHKDVVCVGKRSSAG